MNWIFLIFIPAAVSGLADKFIDDIYVNKEAYQFSNFDGQLLKLESQKAPQKNIVLAPASVKAILALLLEGATGKTAKAIRTVLSLPDNKPEADEQLTRMHLALKAATTKLQMMYSNGIFVSNTLKLTENFRNLSHVYNAEISTVNFAETYYTAIKINNWAKKHTENSITELISPESIQASAKLVLLNAIYFKGKWLYQFHSKDTKIEPFHVEPTRTITTKMMNAKGYYKISYENWLQANVLQIPYQDPRFNFVIILPIRKDGIKQLIKDVNYNRILESLETQDHQEVKLSLPKFDMDFNTGLSDSLTHMMKTNKLFSDSAELPNIAWNANGLKVDSIIHKTSIEVNEEGTKASAASGSSIVPLMTPITEYFTADHPFMFMVYNNEAKIILFEGVLHEPPHVNANGINNVPNQPSNLNTNTRTTVSPHNQYMPSPADRNSPVNNHNNYTTNQLWQQAQPAGVQQHQNAPMTPQQQKVSSNQQPANVQYNYPANPILTQHSPINTTPNFNSPQTGSIRTTQWPLTPSYTSPQSQVNNINNQYNGLQQIPNSNNDAIKYREN